MSADVLHKIVFGNVPSSRFFGVAVGLVTNNQDPDGMARVKVKFPWLSDDDESYWARLSVAMAGKDRGTYFLPEVGDEVLVAFEHGSADFPYVLGSLWNGKDQPPESNSDGNNDNRTIKSRSGHILRLCDKDGDEKIEIIDKSGNNKITLKTSDNTLTIQADSDITIQSKSGKLKLSGNGVEITSQADVKIQASSELDANAGSQMNLKGAMVNIN
ncbi:Rhs element Vgr protein [Candidatus Sulfopaludibacter sp. SbA3]|nr:Rhs element Vgr protein [Candidatus Sulfopaludibacter sp. SbA3]